MYIDLVNTFIAFFEGIVLILSPCILPILPIILASSFTGEKKRPFGIVTGFILMFTLMTLFSRIIIQSLHVSQDTIRNISYAILFLLGLLMVSSFLSEKFTLMTEKLSQVGSRSNIINNPQGGFWSGILFGSLVGIIWTPCAGPILAAVIVQVVLQKTTTSSFFVVIAFAIGAGLPMLLIALMGRKILDSLGFLRSKPQLIRKTLGIIIIITVIYLAFFSTLPLFQLNKFNALSTSSEPATSIIDGLKDTYKVKAIDGIESWINSKPLTWQDLKGKVVLIDFWTYSCINCIRTLPYLKNWYEKYKPFGFVIIGVHSPEFQFEHDVNNVEKAVQQYGILYPVALDNKFVTWQNFRNSYWPAHYLVNKEGVVVYEHFGEGNYDITENNIRYLLGLTQSVTQEMKNPVFSPLQTPETYLGYRRLDRFVSPESLLKDAANQYTYPSKINRNHWALQGEWIIQSDKITSLKSNAGIKLNFYAKHVYAVMGAETSLEILIVVNGKEKRKMIVKDTQLYPLVQLDEVREGTVELIAPQPGLTMYTFTFGS